MNIELKQEPFQILAETLEIDTAIDGTETITATFNGVTLKRKVIASELARGGIASILEQMDARATGIIYDLGKKNIGVLPRLAQVMTDTQLSALAGIEV